MKKIIFIIVFLVIAIIVMYQNGIKLLPDVRPNEKKEVNNFSDSEKINLESLYNLNLTEEYISSLLRYYSENGIVYILTISNCNDFERFKTNNKNSLSEFVYFEYEDFNSLWNIEISDISYFFDTEKNCVYISCVGLDNKFLLESYNIEKNRTENIRMKVVEIFNELQG